MTILLWQVPKEIKLKIREEPVRVEGNLPLSKLSLLVIISGRFNT